MLRKLLRSPIFPHNWKSSNKYRPVKHVINLISASFKEKSRRHPFNYVPALGHLFHTQASKNNSRALNRGIELCFSIIIEKCSEAGPKHIYIMS